MFSKKGQVTVFVIIGVVIVLGIVLFMVYRGNASDRYFEQEGVREGVSEIQDYMIECITYVSQNSLDMVEYQGGYYDMPSQAEELSLENGSVFLPYYTYEGKSYFPNLDSIESEIAKAVDSAAAECIEYAAVTGFDLSSNTVHTDVEIRDNEVEIVVDMPVTIKASEGHVMIFNMNEYPVVIPSKLKGMHNVAKYYIDDLSDDSMYCVNCLGEIAEANDVYIDVLGLDDTTSGVVLSDDSAGEDDMSYYVFLNRLPEDSNRKIEILEGYD